MTVRPLIEQWFPAATIGAESLRDGSAAKKPPVNRLHVWWARRPLTTCRAAVVASLIPAWPESSSGGVDGEDLNANILKVLLDEFPGGQEEYRRWFVRVLGILGDPVLAQKQIAAALANGRRTEGNAYGYNRAYTVSPDAAELLRLRRLSALRSGSDGAPVALDLFSGGGAIPFEAARFGCVSIANELNPVAVAVLNGTIVTPALFGPDLGRTIESWANRWMSRVRARLDEYYPRGSETEKLAYIWANAVPCPTTGRLTPLAPNFWLSRRGERRVAAKVVPGPDGRVQVTIIEGPEAQEWGERATYKRGTATSVWTGETFSGDYIRAKAQAGEMSEVLLSVVVTLPGRGGRQFREPSELDLLAVEAARMRVREDLARWEVEDLVPTEEIPSGKETRRLGQIGIKYWRDLLTPRQLLTYVVCLEEMREILNECENSDGEDVARAIALYLSFAIDKGLNYNSRLSGWHPTRTEVANVFDRHDFAFKWTFAEFDGARALLPWAVGNVVADYRDLADLLVEQRSLFSEETASSARVLHGSAAKLDLADRSVDLIVTDPPYYDNVIYSEISDYFYVWLKRSLRDYWPELCTLTLTDKDAEAVANVSLFRDVAAGSGARSGHASRLADAHYESLLRHSFSEAHRVLKDNGVMTVMFTHKRIDAWDTLGQSLLDSGFAVHSSWPVSTESSSSLNIANKNSATSTVLLTCRKRGDTEPGYWSDIRGEVSKSARDAADRFARDGMHGIDLTLSTFGPVLAVLSRNWPVYSGELDIDGNPQVIRPEVALDLAREEVAQLKKRGLLGGRLVEFDRITDWYLLAWADFAAAEFPYDEARKLSIAVHLEIDELAKAHKIVRAASGSVTILTPAQRRTAGGLDPDAATWPTMIDALHALMLVYEEEGLAAAKAWLARSGKEGDQKFHDLVEASLHAVPRVKDKGEYVRPEARALEGLRATLFDDIEAPAEPDDEIAEPSQLFATD